MSTHKTVVNSEIVINYLKDNFSEEISAFETINGGEGSQAYSFSTPDNQYIIRINRHTDNGFKKDLYAFKNFSKPNVPIPDILKIGKINDELYFCISQKAPGKILDLLSPEEAENIYQKMFEVLDGIHAIDISGTTGFGGWDINGNAKGESWKSEILNVNEHTLKTEDKPGLFETSFLEKDFWDTAYGRLTELLYKCPEERYLVHADFGFNNTLSDGHEITGVIDWEGSMYGDFLYDVAWLSFWSKTDYQKLYLEHIKNKGLVVQDYSERMLCYKLWVGLGAISFFAYSNQKEKYDRAKENIIKLLTS